MRPIGLARTLALYGAFAFILFAATRWGMPALQAIGLRPDISWFVTGGLVFSAFALLTIVLVASETDGFGGDWLARLRIRRMTTRDWRIAFAGLGMAAAGAAVVLALLKLTLPEISLHPPFLHMQPLGAGERWVLLVWAPMFALNILGEEAFGRGYLLPRNELAAGKAGWLVNGCGWLLFHVAFGFVILALAAPLIFATCWAAQKSRNTVVAIFIHTVVNGPTFLAMSLGLLPG